jgi:hypothetical protein
MSAIVRGRIGSASFLIIIALGLLGAVLLWGQVLTKEYINLNGRTLAIEVPAPLVTMLNVAPGGSYPIHTTQQTISFRVDNSAGFDHLELLLNNTADTVDDSCYMMYYPATNDFQLLDATDNWVSYTFGAGASPTTAQNNHCTLDLVDTSITATATSVTMNVVTTIRPSSVGQQYIYVQVVDPSYNYFYFGIPRASWMAYDELTTNPPTYSLLQAPVSGNSQTLYFKFSDGNGYRYIDTEASVMIAYDALGANAPCSFSFHPFTGYASLDSYANGVDTNIASGFLSSGWSYDSGHPCDVNLTSTKFHINPDPTKPPPDPNLQLVTDYYLDLVITLDSTLTHPLNVYAGAIDRENRGMEAAPLNLSLNSPSFQVGTWP